MVRMLPYVHVLAGNRRSLPRSRKRSGRSRIALCRRKLCSLGRSFCQGMIAPLEASSRPFRSPFILPSVFSGSRIAFFALIGAHRKGQMIFAWRQPNVGARRATVSVRYREVGKERDLLGLDWRSLGDTTNAHKNPNKTGTNRPICY